MQATHTTPHTLATLENRMIKIQGPARSGKTECLVLRVKQLLEEGIAPQNILVATASAFAAQAFRNRVISAVGSAGNDITIASPLHICTNVLDTPIAQAATGRVPRLLNSGEYKFFLEDMKTLGQKPRRMRTMLNFFYAQWAALEDEENWVLAGEEADMLSYVRKFLVQRNAMLPEEVGYVCARFLQSDEGKQARHAYTHVLCDDFQNYSRAEQTVLCLLATDQLVVAGNPAQTVALRSSLACPDGFADFETLRHGVSVYTLDEYYGNAQVKHYVLDVSAHIAANASSAQAEAVAHPDKSDTSVLQGSKRMSGAFAVKWDTPEDELEDMTKFLRVAADHRKDSDGDIVAIVPNRRWARMVASVLRQRGFACNLAGLAAGLGGDPRDTNRCAAMIAYAKLNLLADPRDMVAWRSWCGIGNYLTNSDAWAHLGEFADTCGIGLYEALEQVAASSGELFLRANALREKFNEGREFISKNAGRKGFNLLSAVGALGLEEFSNVEQTIAGDETAEEVFALQQQTFLDPSYPERINAVRIVTPENMCGLEAKVVCVFGAVDGFYPKRDAFEVVSTDEERETILGSSRRAFVSAVSKADELLVVSYFGKADLELAEQTKMQVTRVKSEQGNRIAMLRPSQFIREGEASLPTIGGQQLIAEIGL